MSQFVMSKFATQADMYAAMKARIVELEADNKAAWTTNRAIYKARMEDRARADGWEDIAMMMVAWHRANTVDDKAEASEDERAECAKLMDLSTSELQLLAGEMTAQELRTVKAVLRNRAAAIMERPNVEVTGATQLHRGASVLTAGLAGNVPTKKG